MSQFFSTQKTIWLEPGWALVRILTGLLMTYHGWELFDAAKMNEYAGWLTYFSASTATALVYIGKAAELVSGILLTVGLFTRLAVWPMIATMLFIAFIIGNGKIWYGDQHPFFICINRIAVFLSRTRKI